MEKIVHIQFDRNRYRIYNWKNPMVLHWILNPGLVINELILGQKIPKIMLEDKTIEKPKYERTYIPCPHCGKMHDSRTWASKNGTAFRNWFGLYCNYCGEIIPCLMNLTSLLILAITLPLWFWFRKPLKAKWLAAQPKRYENIDYERITNVYSNKKWIKQGLFFGLFMFISMSLIMPLIDNELPLNLMSILIGIPIWAIAGLFYGFFMKLLLEKKGKKTASLMNSHEL